MATTVRVRFEQAVYGSFPFWDKGYAVLARSPGCRPEWLADLKAACQRFGERPPGAAAAGGLFALKLPSGPWAIVGVGSPGADDRGRPGALAFHALLLTPRAYRKAGASPFGLAGALRRDWGPETRALPASSWTVEVDRSAPGRADDPKAARIAEALARGRRVALEADGPIDDLADSVWQALPGRVRRRASVATWAFGNANRFDLVALPRLDGVTLDPSYVDIESSAPSAPMASTARPGRRRVVLVLGILVAAALGLFALIRNFGIGDRPDGRPTTGSSRPASLDEAPPDRSAYRHEPADDERALVAEGLLDLAEQFGVAEDVGRNPVDLMAHLAGRLRYRGPWLGPGELSRLEAGREGNPEARRALDWHEQVRRFAPDRPLPDDFERGPLRWQLDVLTWSFHLDPDPLRSSAEIPHRLARDLAVDGPIRPHPLADRYPALSAYAAFLERLPRR